MKKDHYVTKTWNTFLFLTILLSFFVGLNKSYKIVLLALFLHLFFLFLEYLERKNWRKEQYLNLILQENITSLDLLSLKVKISKDKVKHEIVRLMQKGYLKGRLIDLEIDEVVLERDLLLRKKELEKINNEDENKNIKKYKSVKCSGCGAKNRVEIGNGSYCEFCHTFIEG